MTAHFDEIVGKCWAGCMAHQGVCGICQINAQPGPTALDNLLMCSIVPLGFIALLLADFIISLRAISTQLSEKGAIGGLCVCVCVCVRVDGGVKLALSFSLIGARTRPSGYSTRSLSLHLCLGVGAARSACHC